MRTANVQAELDDSDLIAVHREMVRNSEKILVEGDILVSSANSWNLVGKCCRVPSLAYPATAGGFISILRPTNGQLDAGYLYRWFSSERIQSTVRSFGNQTTNISNLSHKRTLDLQIPLPPLPEQRRIAAILDAADALRTKRRESLELLDKLVQSVFLDMFGDPVTNPKGWEIGSLSDLGTFGRGKSKHRPRNDPALLNGTHPLIQTGEVRQSFWFIRDFTQTYSDLGLRQSKYWPSGTLCITIAANIAETGILTFDACFPDSVVGFVPHQSASTHYVQGVMGFLQKILERRAPQVAQKNINLEILNKLPIPLPPLDIQTQFRDVIETIFEQRAKLEQHLAALDTLFASLQSRAFRGEL